MKEQIVAELIKLAEENPEEWDFNGYTASVRGVAIWTENRPYADMTLRSLHGEKVTDKKLGGYFTRRKLRKAIDSIQIRLVLKALGEPTSI
jgi:hypothetical protein